MSSPRDMLIVIDKMHHIDYVLAKAQHRSLSEFLPSLRTALAEMRDSADPV
jgi:hypothetical protein